MGNQWLTVAVENGATSKTEGAAKPIKVLKKHAAQSPCTLVFLKRSGHLNGTKQLADTPFVEKEEAREVGLCKKVHLGLQMP